MAGGGCDRETGQRRQNPDRLSDRVTFMLCHVGSASLSFSGHGTWLPQSGVHGVTQMGQQQDLTGQEMRIRWNLRGHSLCAVLENVGPSPNTTLRTGTSVSMAWLPQEGLSVRCGGRQGPHQDPCALGAPQSRLGSPGPPAAQEIPNPGHPRSCTHETSAGRLWGRSWGDAREPTTDHVHLGSDRCSSPSPPPMSGESQHPAVRIFLSEQLRRGNLSCWILDAQ